MKWSASAAISAGWFVLWKAVSPWSRWIRGWRRRVGRTAPPEKRASRRASDLLRRSRCVLHGEGDQLRRRMQFELLANVLSMIADRVHTKVHGCGDLLSRFAQADLLQDLFFSWGENLIEARTGRWV